MMNVAVFFSFSFGRIECSQCSKMDLKLKFADYNSKQLLFLIVSRMSGLFFSFFAGVSLSLFSNAKYKVHISGVYQAANMGVMSSVKLFLFFTFQLF